MSLEIRTAQPEEMDRFFHIASLALAEPKENLQGMRPEWTFCAFENGKMTTSFGAWPFTMRFNGAGVRVSGITCVGTHPVYRRRGYLRKIMTSHFDRLHEAGEQPIAILYASMAAIYQRFGFGVVSTHQTYKVEPRFLHFTLPISVPGTLREATTEDMPLLLEVYKRFREPRTGCLHRGRDMWDTGILGDVPPGAKLSIIIYEEEVPLGYAIFTTGEETTDSTGPSQRLHIRDLVWLNPASYRAIWECLGHMDLVREIDWQRVPSDDPLPHLLLEPRQLRAVNWDGILARLVDLQQALSSRPYPVDADLTMEVLDDVCSWNKGTWQIGIEGAGASVSRTSRSPQLTMPVSTLAMLAFGQITATEAYRMGRLDVHDSGSLPAWDAALRTVYRPACPDHF